MTKKGRKKARNIVKKFRNATLWIMGFLTLLAGVFLVLLLVHQREKAPSLSPQPAYEEIHSHPRPLQKEINLIDQAIYHVLYKEGIKEKDILFTEVGHRHIDNGSWDFVEIRINVKDKQVLSRLETGLEKRLSELGPNVQWIKDTAMPRETRLDVFAVKQCTHRVSLVIEEPKVPARKPMRPKIAIIIDDFGYDTGLARSFAELDIPLCMSVLPRAPRTRDVVEIIKGHHRELLLHMPMEPKGYPGLNPGPGALLCRMSREETKELVRRHLREVPEASGVNNHMGSLLTERREQMTAFLEEIRNKDLFFIDSRTSGSSVAYRLAKEMGVRSAKRNVFLDNEPSKNAIDIQMERLLGIARHRGSAIGIAHPFPGTLRALESRLERLRAEVELVSASQLAK